MTAKDVVVGGVTSMFRAYVRYVPFSFGKELLFKKILHPYLTWRKFSTTAKTTFGAKLAVALPDLIQSRIYFFGLWEPNLTQFIRKTLSPGDHFVDVGANVGYFSLLASTLVGAEGTVFAIEASPKVFGMLQHNVSINGCENVRLFNMAASDAKGTLALYFGNANNIGSTTTVATVAKNNNQQLEAHVPAETLDAIVGREALLKARLIKINVEGAEGSVIRGICHLLPYFSDSTEWVMEVSPGRMEAESQAVEELVGSFRKAGYRLYHLENDYRVGAYISRRKEASLAELHEITGQVDVVATKRRL